MLFMSSLTACFTLQCFYQTSLTMKWDFRLLCSSCVLGVCLCMCVCEYVRASVHLNGTVSQRGMPWPQSCLSLSQINSNCLIQLFTGPVADVPLYSSWPQMHNGHFIMQIGAGWAWGNWRAIWKGWPNGWQKCRRGESIDFSTSKMAF